MAALKTIGEDRHGKISAVFVAGIQIGTIKKWHGLFVAEGFQPVTTRKEAIQKLVESHEFETGGRQ